MSNEQATPTSEKPKEAIHPATEATTTQQAEAMAAASLETLENTASTEAQITPEQQAATIAEKYFQQIPEADRKPISPDDMDLMFHIMEGAMTNGGVVNTSDRFGNLPIPVLEAIGNKDRSKAMQALRAFADHPLEHAHEIGKLAFLGKIKNVPATVLRALTSITLMEGKASTQTGMREVADLIEQASPETDPIITISEYKQSRNSSFAEGDVVRHRAILELFEKLYPTMKDSSETLLIFEISGARSGAVDEAAYRKEAKRLIDKAISICPGLDQSPFLQGINVDTMNGTLLKRLMNSDLTKAIKRHLAQRLGGR